MFTLYYKYSFYNIWKSGLLLDFLFKRFIFSFLMVLYYYFNILFSEKYFIENNFLKIILYLDYFRGLFTIYSKYFSTYLVGFVWIFSLFLFFFLYV